MVSQVMAVVCVFPMATKLPANETVPPAGDPIPALHHATSSCHPVCLSHVSVTSNVSVNVSVNASDVPAISSIDSDAVCYDECHQLGWGSHLSIDDLADSLQHLCQWAEFHSSRLATECFWPGVRAEIAGLGGSDREVRRFNQASAVPRLLLLLADLLEINFAPETNQVACEV